MALRDRLDRILLWALAVVFVAAALADVAILGFDGATLAMLATVFAATAGASGRKKSCAA